MSGSRSHTPTISHPSTLWIWAAWASAIFPHPTMATLSIPFTRPAALEILAQSLRCSDLRSPAQLGLQFFVAIVGLLPLGVPSSPIESWRQLPLRPLRILLPHIAKHIAN